MTHSCLICAEDCEVEKGVMILLLLLLLLVEAILEGKAGMWCLCSVLKQGL